jgi:hypothetical protein
MSIEKTSDLIGNRSRDLPSRTGFKDFKSDGHSDYLARSRGRVHWDIFLNFIVPWNPLYAQATVTLNVNKHTVKRKRARLVVITAWD